MAAQSTKRLFIAIQLNPELIARVKDLKMKAYDLSNNPAFRWTATENLHMTQVFLGDIDVSQIPSMTQLLDQMTSHHDQFELSFSGLGCFPNVNNPRIFWMGLEEAEALRQLYNRLVRGIKGLLTLERPRFSPHVTLARIKDYANDRTIKELKRLVVEHEQTLFGHLQVQSVTVFESDLQRGGPVYKMIHQSMLK